VNKIKDDNRPRDQEEQSTELYSDEKATAFKKVIPKKFQSKNIQLIKE